MYGDNLEKLSRSSSESKPEVKRRTLQITNDCFNRLQRDYKSKSRDVSFSQYVSNKLSLMFNKEEWVMKNYPGLRFMTVDGNTVIIKDDNDNELYQVKLIEDENEKVAVKYSRFECDKCTPKTHCMHVMMAQSIKMSSMVNIQ